MDILFIGHSLIEFFDWQKRFPEHRVLNLGVAGETVEGLLSRVERIIEKHPFADIIFIMSGINDVAMGDPGIFDSYSNIIERLSSAYPKAKIFINSILPTLLEFIPDESVRDANETLKKLAMDKGVGYLDIHSLFVAPDGKAMEELFLDDGVHLSNKGYAIWSKAMEKIINK